LTKPIALASTPTEASESSEEHLETLLSQARDVLGRIRDLHQQLAESPSPDGAEESELLDLIRQRAELGPALGAAVVRVLATGADVRISAATTPDEDDEPLAEEPTEFDDAQEDAKAPPAPETADDGPEGEFTDERESEAADEPEEVVEDEPEEVVEDEPAEEPSAPPPKPAPAAALQALAQRGIGGLAPSQRSDLEDIKVLKRLLRTFGQPQGVDTDRKAEAIIRLLDKEVGGIDAWTDQPPFVQKALLGMMAALARHVQDEFDGSLPYVVSDALPGIFSRMTRYSRVERPGFVAGLSRRNDPEHGQTWLDDARHWFSTLEERTGPLEPEAEEGTPESALAQLEEAIAEGVDDRKQLVALVKVALETGLSQSDRRLVALLTPHQSLLKGARGLKTLKGALKDALRDEDDFEEAQDKGRPVPSEWPHFDMTLDKRAVIIGGDPRPAALDRIQDAFGFADVQWEVADVRRANTIADRVRGGSIDVVLLLIRFINHRHQTVIKPACNEAGVPLIIVESGYGVDAVRRGIERMAD
jgi:hypothetical protein